MAFFHRIPDHKFIKAGIIYTQTNTDVHKFWGCIVIKEPLAWIPIVSMGWGDGGRWDSTLRFCQCCSCDVQQGPLRTKDQFIDTQIIYIQTDTDVHKWQNTTFVFLQQKCNVISTVLHSAVLLECAFPISWLNVPTVKKYSKSQLCVCVCVFVTSKVTRVWSVNVQGWHGG